MRLEGDYALGRIVTDEKSVDKIVEDYQISCGSAHVRLSRAAGNLASPCVVFADSEEDGYEPANFVLDAAHAARVGLGRMNLPRMREAAKSSLAEKGALLQDKRTTENLVSALTEECAATERKLAAISPVQRRSSAIRAKDFFKSTRSISVQ